MPSALIDCLGTTDPLAEVFSDLSVLQAMLDVEAALARASARAGAIPGHAAAAITAAARAQDFDAAAIASEARRGATPSIPLVVALTNRVREASPEAAQYVHWGATSQDVSDSALVLLLRRARTLVAADHARLARTLPAISDRHAAAVMLGRTLLQPAPPITFGLKAAGWSAALHRAGRRLDAAWQDALVVQLGGAAGTRAAFGPHEASIGTLLAAELDLAAAPPWHTDRDRLGALVAACGLYTAALGKIARDITLLMQAEVAEVFEPGGGSSAMPHKRNPAGCVIALAAAARLPGLVAGFLGSMVQEHERAAGGSQAEWPVISAAVQATGAAAAAMADVLENLTVDTVRMRANMEATRGIVLAEAAVMRLAPLTGGEAARMLVSLAVQRTRETGGLFVDALKEMPDVTAVLSADDLRDLGEPERYLGAAERLRQELLAGGPRGSSQQ